MSEIISKDSPLVGSFFNSMDNILYGLELLTQNCRPVFNGEIYLSDKELSHRLRISRKTLQEWRNRGKIEYIQLEGKIIYSESAVQRLLDRHYQKAWSCEHI